VTFANQNAFVVASHGCIRVAHDCTHQNLKTIFKTVEFYAFSRRKDFEKK
jgi:hypothetical protein